MFRAIAAAVAASALVLVAPASGAQAADVFPELILERFRQAGLPSPAP